MSHRLKPIACVNGVLVELKLDKNATRIQSFCCSAGEGDQ